MTWETIIGLVRIHSPRQGGMANTEGRYAA